MTRRHHRPRTRPQRGAVTVLAAIAMVAMLTATMLAVEIGRMYNSHRQLTKLASMAALDGVRIVGGCDSPRAPTVAAIQAEVGRSLNRNSAGELFTETSSLIGVGYVTSSGGLRRLTDSPADEATAVGVTLSQAFPEPFLPLFNSRAGHKLTANAIATQEIVAQISVGTSLLSLDTADSGALNALMSGLLGGNVGLDLLSYQGLANAHVSMDQLAAAAGVATPGDLLDLQVTLPGGLQILADALNAGGNGAQAAAAAALESLAGVVSPDRREFPFGDVLKIEPGVENIAGALPINTLELLMALSQSAAQGYPITLPIAVNIPGLSNLVVRARIGSPATIAFGRPGFLENGTARTQAHTSQVYLEISAQLANVGPLRALLPALLRPLLPANAALNIHAVAEVAPATATLTQVRCAWSGLPHHEVTVDVESALASVALGSFDDLGNAVPQLVAPPPLLNLGALSIRLNDPLSEPIGEHFESVDFSGPFVPRVSQVIEAQHVAEVGGGVSQTLDSAVNGLTLGLADNLSFGGAMGTVFNALGLNQAQALVGATFNPVWKLLDAVLGNVLQLLGVQLGTATVTVESVDIHPPEVFNRNR
ncbi:MAG TPA: hypothetical protein VM074_02080 [Solimonas sp.]|nr:hypothetical protein [Solimonas sp.]